MPQIESSHVLLWQNVSLPQLSERQRLGVADPEAKGHETSPPPRYTEASLTKRLEELGMKGFTHPLKVSCEDHEGSGPIRIQQWDGQKWTLVSDWIAPMKEIVRPKIEAAAVEEGKKLGYTQRDCSKEK